MKVSAGWFVSTPCDVEFIGDMVKCNKFYVQAGFYERKDLSWVLALSQYSDKISSIHLPKGLTASDYAEGGVVDELMEAFNTNLFVVHPWADDLQHIVWTVNEREKFCLCLEGFSLSKGKGGVINLVENFGKDMRNSSHVGLCLDFSHIEPEVMNWQLAKALLPYTKMFHVSTVVDGKPHRPMHSTLSAILVKPLLHQFLQIPETPVMEVVLEYDKEYQKQLVMDVGRMNEWFEEKRRKFKDVQR
jgi:hypothetical protein